MKTKIIIDPSTNIVYSSFYIKGLYQFFGKRNVRFARSMKFFKDLNRKEVPNAYDQYLAFVILEGKKISRVIIDFREEPSIEETAHNWCDVYGKVNFNKESTNPRFLSKVVKIPQSIANNLWGLWETAFLCLRNIVCAFSSFPITIRRHVGYYYLQLKRPKIEVFQPGKSKKDYIFFNSTLWTYGCTVGTTNVWRKEFVEECLSNEKIEFEGGFIASPTNPNYEMYQNLVSLKRYKTKEYLSKTKRSGLVFNTPSVLGCHGWKLAEYLAMGKAIISTPLNNEIPFGLLHGEAIHFIENASQIKPAINRIISDDEYRNKLEQGAYEYYLNHGTPAKVIKQVYDFLKKN